MINHQSHLVAWMKFTTKNKHPATIYIVFYQRKVLDNNYLAGWSGYYPVKHNIKSMEGQTECKLLLPVCIAVISLR